MTQFDSLAPVLATAPVIPVMVVDQIWHAVPLARALVAGGLPVLEITLRTRVAVDAIKAIRDAVPDAIVGAGTVLTPEQFEAVEREGARFAVSPGATEHLLGAAGERSIPLLPGASTVSEVMTLRERGYRFLKFFPAEAAGGTTFLGALPSVLPDVKFCPTGGVTPQNARSYLKLSNVVCVGGSWVTPKALVAAEDWGRIEALAREASAMKV